MKNTQGGWARHYIKISEEGTPIQCCSIEMGFLSSFHVIQAGTDRGLMT